MLYGSSLPLNISEEPQLGYYAGTKYNQKEFYLSRPKQKNLLANK